MNKIIKLNFNDHRKVLIKTFSKLEDKIFFAADLVSRALANKNLIMWCGNGGSASDSMHISAELFLILHILCQRDKYVNGY